MILLTDNYPIASVHFLSAYSSKPQVNFYLVKLYNISSNELLISDFVCGCIQIFTQANFIYGTVFFVKHTGINYLAFQVDKKLSCESETPRAVSIPLTPSGK